MTGEAVVICTDARKATSERLPRRARSNRSGGRDRLDCHPLVAQASATGAYPYFVLNVLNAVFVLNRRNGLRSVEILDKAAAKRAPVMAVFPHA